MTALEGMERYVDCLDRLGDHDTVKLESSVTLNRRASGIAVTLFETDIITFTPEHTLVLKCNGYKTKTTCQKLNKYLPNGWQVKSKNGEWVVMRGETKIPYEEYMEIAL